MVFYDAVTVEYIYGGVRGFTLSSYVEGYPLDDGRWFICHSIVENPYEPLAFEESEAVCVYLLLYPQRDSISVKIGNAGLSSCVSRMFQQAPPLAIVSDIIVPEIEVLKTVSSREDVDKAIVEKLRKYLYRSKRRMTVKWRVDPKTIIDSWTYLVKVPQDSHLVVENLLTVGLELASVTSKHLIGMGFKPLLPKPGITWFTTIEALSNEDITLMGNAKYIGRKLLERVCNKRGRVYLRQLPNGLFHVMLDNVPTIYGNQRIEGLVAFNDIKVLDFKVIST